MSEMVLEAKELHYYYPDGTHALKGVSFKLERGKTTAILGGNGAGKSTLFLNCNGILKPASGELFYNERKVDYTRKSINELRRAVGLVFLQGTPKEVFAEVGVLRKIHLRIPRIAHLIEILQKKDGFNFVENAVTISAARKAFQRWRDNMSR